MRLATKFILFTVVSSFIILISNPVEAQLIQGFGLASQSGGKCLDVVLNLNLLLDLSILNCGTILTPGKVWTSIYTGSFDLVNGPAYQIASNLNGKCLTNLNGAVVLQSCGDNSNQLWWAKGVSLTSQYNQWISVADGKCLTLNNVLLLIDTLNTATCSDTAANQQWVFK